jgi:O-antigen biosynthesis protein WbqP
MDFDVAKRLIDIVLSIVLLVTLSWLLLLVGLAVRLTSPGPALYWSERVGREGRIFRMPKFRSMPVDTPALATHLWQPGEVRLTPMGGFLRRLSIDELPQLWSILRGDMSLVGPRPALFNQYDLIELRKRAGVDKLRPGVTGLAQVNGRDDLSIPEKVALDAEYMRSRSFALDLKISLQTLARVVRSDGVRH